MINLKDIRRDIDELGTLGGMVSAYQEIAAGSMRRIRNNVLQKRDFLDGLSTILNQLKTSYKQEIAILEKQRKKRKSVIPTGHSRTFFGHSRESGNLDPRVREDDKGGEDDKVRTGTVHVLLSANTGLYGDIVKKTYDLFMTDVRKGDADAVIIGRLGNKLFQNEKIRIGVQYFDFPDNAVDSTSLRKIAEYLLEYEKIFVYYGEFQSVVNQKATKKSISEDDTSTPSPSSPTRPNSPTPPKVRYLFEPSLEEILTFFQSEIFASIFEQTMNESQLAKFASRMMTLDKALENIRVNIKKSESEHTRMKHRIANGKQLNSLAGVSLWRR